MSNEIKTFFSGKGCRECEALGVRCAQAGVLTSGVLAETGQVVIYLNEKAVLITTETIDNCPAITGQKTNNEVVAEINKKAKKAVSRVTIGQIGNY